MLLLAKSVQELMGLSEDLRNESIFIEILYVVDFSFDLVVLMGYAIDFAKEVFVLEEYPPILSVVINFLIERWGFAFAHYFTQVISSNLLKR
jgi:hypothetical protein